MSVVIVVLLEIERPSHATFAKGSQNKVCCTQDREQKPFQYFRSYRTLALPIYEIFLENPCHTHTLFNCVLILWDRYPGPVDFLLHDLHITKKTWNTTYGFPVLN